MKDPKPTMRLYKRDDEPLHTVMYSVDFVGNGEVRMELRHMSYMNLKRTLRIALRDVKNPNWLKGLLHEECDKFIKWCKKRILHDGVGF